MRIIVSCMSRALLQFRFLKLLKYIILSFMMHFEYSMHVVYLWEKWMGVYNIYVSYPHSTLKEVCIHCLTVLYHLKARISLIPSPPTYNTNYGYLNWESYYNLSYYTMILPPIPEDCPLPMGSKGISLNYTQCIQVYPSYCRSVMPRGTYPMEYCV